MHDTQPPPTPYRSDWQRAREQLRAERERQVELRRQERREYGVDFGPGRVPAGIYP